MSDTNLRCACGAWATHEVRVLRVRRGSTAATKVALCDACEGERRDECRSDPAVASYHDSPLPWMR